MRDVHEVFLANSVQYWIIGGTLLGAIRHKGIIPWDDDLDIGMTTSFESRFLGMYVVHLSKVIHTSLFQVCVANLENWVIH